MASQNSIFAYVPQPYHVEGTTGQQYVAESAGVASILNDEGLFDPDLSNYTTVIGDSGETTFGIDIVFPTLDDWLGSYSMTVALVGCSMKTYEDSGGSPDLTTEFEEDVSVSIQTQSLLATDVIALCYAHNTHNTIRTFNGESLPGIISGGRTNLVASGLGAPKATNGSHGITVYAWRLAANVTARPHAYFEIGHVFIGVEIPVTIDANSFVWSLAIDNERAAARDLGAVNSEGTIVRQCSGEFTKIGNYDIIGSEVTAVAIGASGWDVPSALTRTANFFDLIKANTSYPLLFNPYPYPFLTANDSDIAGWNLTARQNFFSIYGFMDDPLQITTDEYRDGLNSLYQARFRITETR